jgi:hypothetical protein
MTDTETRAALSEAIEKLKSKYNIELDTPELTKEFYDTMHSVMYTAMKPILDKTSSLGNLSKTTKITKITKNTTGAESDGDKSSRRPNHYARLMTYFSAKGLPLADGSHLSDVLPGIYYQVTIPPASEFKKTKTGEYPEWVRWIENEYPKHKELCDAFITTKRSKVVAFAKFLGFEGMGANSFIWSICMPGNKDQKIGVKHTWANIIYPMIHESGDGKTFVLRNESGPVTFASQPNTEIDESEAVYDDLFARATVLPVRLPAPGAGPTEPTDPNVLQ